MRYLCVLVCFVAVPAFAKPANTTPFVRAARKAGYENVTVVEVNGAVALVLAEKDGARRALAVGQKGALLDLGDATQVTAGSVTPFLGQKALWDLKVVTNTQDKRRSETAEQHHVVRVSPKKVTLACTFAGTSSSSVTLAEDGESTKEVTVAKAGDKPLSFTITTVSVAHHSQPATTVSTWTFAADGTCGEKK